MSKKKTPKPRKPVGNPPAATAVPGELLAAVRALIDQARDATARAVNSALVLLYWSVGDRIRRDVLKEKRADYGQRVVVALARQLGAEYGKGFTADNLFRMVQFAEVFPDREIVGALSRQLGWSHFLLLLPVKDALKREFYAEMCRVERWSVRTLREKLGGMLFERTALSRKPAELARRELADLRSADQLSPDLVVPRPVPPRLPRAEGQLQRTGPGGRHPQRDGGVPPRTRRRVHVRRPSEADGDRRRRLRPRPALLPPEVAAADRRGPQTGQVRAGLQGADGTLPLMPRSA